MLIKSKAKTSSELRKELRSLTPYRDDLILGDRAIMKTSSSYGVRGINDHNDPMTDYSAYIYGFKEKWIVDRAINEKRIKPSPAKSTSKKILKLKFKKWGVMKAYIKYLVNEVMFDDLKSANEYKEKLQKLNIPVTMHKVTRTLERDIYQLMIV